MNSLDDQSEFSAGGLLAFFFIPLPEPIGLPADVVFLFPQYEDPMAS